MYKAVIIGCGQIAGGYDELAPVDSVSTHIRAYRTRSDIDVVGVMDKMTSKAQQFAKKWGIPKVYSSLDEILRKAQPDIVSVCSPNETHIDVLNKCSEAPIKAVWCEKPIAIDSKPVRKILDKYKSKKIPVLVNYMRRWMDQTLVVKEKIKRNELGKILFVTGCYTKGIRHNGSHSVDLLRFLFGEPRSFVALDRRPDLVSNDKVVDAQFVLSNGVSATLKGLGNPGFFLWEFDIVGTEGRARFLNGGEQVEWSQVVGSGFSRTLEVSDLVTSNLKKVMRNVLDSLIDAFQNGTPLVSDGYNGLRTLEICNSLIKGSK